MPEIDSMILYTKVIPAILIFLLVFFNIRKMQKRAAAMRREHSCGGSCSGCAHHTSCHSADKDADQKNS